MIRCNYVIIVVICLLLLQGCSGGELPVDDQPQMGTEAGGDPVAVVVPPEEGRFEEPGVGAAFPLDSYPEPENGGEEQVKQINNNGELYTLGPFFGVLPQIEWSPEGKKLALSGYNDGYGIWILDYASGRFERVLTISTQQEAGFIGVQLLGWSPGGGELYYAVDGPQASGPYSGSTGISIGRVVLSAAEEMSVQEVAWLSGGQIGLSQLKLTAEGSLLVHRSGELWRIDVETGEKELLQMGLPQRNGLFQVSFSPSGRYVVYQQETGDKNSLFLLDTRTGQGEDVIADADYHFFPVWSHTGEKVAFLTGVRQEEGYDLYRGEDGALPPATFFQVFSLQDKVLTRYRVPGRQVGAPIWSPDGKRLAFLSARWEEGDTNPWGADFSWEGLWEVELESGELQLLTPLKGEWFSLAGWSPTGEQIYLYRYEADGSSSLLVVDRREQEVLFTIQEAIDEPVLWHKGSIIVGRVLEDVANGELYTEIYTVDAGGRATQLTNNGGWKNSFQCWADRMVFVRGDTTDPSYPLYVEILSLSED
jgi:Tol biopolymer transport system component